MLQLKRVEIQGFKSFFDKTEMRFNGSGIAAVVGPNGCGKSNLSDAISWVLGEQSAKTLRGSRMEDVIFAGTREKKPLGMASVTMTLVDPGVPVLSGNGRGPAAETGESAVFTHALENAAKAHNEVTITRRLFRSGESEYLINGRIARLRDIQDLFMGTGLGPESYAIIEQGRIGQILSNRPQDRRSVIEEAAGITRFRTRKRLAEGKLEGAKANLSRVFDILEEVGRQVNSLKRQAAKAKRYGELKAELGSQLRTALSGRFRVIERAAAKAALDLNAAAAEYGKVALEVNRKEQDYAALQQASYRTESALTETRKQLSDTHVEFERTRGRLESQAKQIAAMEHRLAQGEQETAELEIRFDAGHAELGAVNETLLQLESETEAARAKLASKTAEREELQRSLQDRSRALEDTRQTVLRLLGEASALRNQLAQIQEYLASTERDSARSVREEQTALSDLERLGGLRGELSRKLAARQMELHSVADQRRAIETQLGEARAKAAEARRVLDNARADASRAKARRDSLEEIISHRSYTTENVKRFFTAIEKNRRPDLQPAGVLADFIEVADASYEKAVEEFLHEELEYVVVRDWAQAEAAMDLMRTDLDGRATFLVHPDPGIAAVHETATPVEQGALGRLSDLLRLTNGLSQTPAAMIPKIGNCYLAADRATAQRLAMAHPDAYFLLPDGVSYHGYAVSGGKKKGSGPLGLKRELRELDRSAAEKQATVDQTAARISILDREMAALTEEGERLRSAEQAHERDTLGLTHESRKLNEEFARAQSRLSLARLDLERIRNESERARVQQESSGHLLEEKEAARREAESALQQTGAQLEEMAAEAARVGEAHAALRADMAGFEERRRAEKASQGRLETSLREVAGRREALGGEMQRLGVERARFLSDNIQLDARVAELDGAIASFEATVAQLAEEECGSRARLQELEDELKRLRAAHQAAQETRSRHEVELVKLQAELKYLDETSQKELGIGAGELSGGSEIVLAEEELAAAERAYADLRAKIDALGPVNPDALAEFGEAQQRHDFLSAQRQDLLDSIRDTEKAIGEIDAESRKRFTEAFQAINLNFREIFQTLFGGGVGEMRLTNEENIGESGIDIVASPPGKKLQNVLLLSGGEKSLTAMALLMAIFQYQPSPFCILDEVDAPLDEPNIERLTHLLKDMAEQTQFIVITHAKRTMEAAQSLYGVTMQEPGVSKLVSVRFQAAPANGKGMPPPAIPVPEPIRQIGR